MLLVYRMHRSQEESNIKSSRPLPGTRQPLSRRMRAEVDVKLEFEIMPDDEKTLKDAYYKDDEQDWYIQYGHKGPKVWASLNMENITWPSIPWEGI